MMVLHVILEGITNEYHVSTLHSQVAGVWGVPGSRKPLAVSAILPTLKRQTVIPVRGIPARTASSECSGKMWHAHLPATPGPSYPP